VGAYGVVQMGYRYPSDTQLALHGCAAIGSRARSADAVLRATRPRHCSRADEGGVAWDPMLQRIR
jgi:hypothetical protein